MEAYVVLCCGYCGWCCNGHGMQISLPHPDLTSLGPLPCCGLRSNLGVPQRPMCWTLDPQSLIWMHYGHCVQSNFDLRSGGLRKWSEWVRMRGWSPVINSMWLFGERHVLWRKSLLQPLLPGLPHECASAPHLLYSASPRCSTSDCGPLSCKLKLTSLKLLLSGVVKCCEKLMNRDPEVGLLGWMADLLVTFEGPPSCFPWWL